MEDQCSADRKESQNIMASRLPLALAMIASLLVLAHQVRERTLHLFSGHRHECREMRHDETPCTRMQHQRHARAATIIRGKHEALSA